MDGEKARIFLCGDVMTGRGIDQILPHPSVPHIFESYVTDARGYVTLAERASGPIPSPVDFVYPWGDAIAVFEKLSPDLRIINLETAVTESEEWEAKGINYRMSPRNIRCLADARIDACALANNHVLDWGYAGLEETLDTLKAAGIPTAGAGRNVEEAQAPAVLALPGKGAVHLFSFGLESSGIPRSWSAGPRRAGVNLLPDLSSATVADIAGRTRAVKGAGNAVVVSLHWGGNWGWEVEPEERRFAHQLIDTAGADVVYGHSSHHVKGLELYHGRLIMYGCGDFINDYEGISGYEAFRGDLGLMYFPDLDLETGAVVKVTMVPTRLHRFRVQSATAAETDWLCKTLNREGKGFGTGAEVQEDGTLVLRESST